ncbi:MAG TPA: S-adenosylmethionine:tRNA ribosyltransferase-isomerase [Polyangiaceae bacterium]
MTGATLLRAARAPRRSAEHRLLHLDPLAGTWHDRPFAALPEAFRYGDLLVVNDAATLPSSLRLTSHEGELRLVGRDGERRFRAVVFGPGDFRTPTELRGEAPPLGEGDRVRSGSLEAAVVAVDPDAPRLVGLEFALGGAELLAALYREGRVIQYAYVEQPLELWDVQNRFAGRPWAFEPPSAGLPLTFGLLESLRARGVRIAWLSHAAGISSTGSAALDRRLPFPERYEIPAATIEALASAREHGARVVAVGTTVVRALEDSALLHGFPRAGPGEARLILGPGFRPRVVNGILTGMHEPSTSHYSLLEAFAPRRQLERATAAAGRLDYLQHEFGDSLLIL